MSGDDPLEWIKRRLRNWGAWTRKDAWPKLDVGEHPAYALYNARKAWEDGWGDPGPPEPPLMPVDEADALQIESALLNIQHNYRQVLKGEYAEARYYTREVLDIACRALVDRLDVATK